MNLEKVFNFIKEKRGYDYPIVYKLINGLPLSEDELNVDGDLYLSSTNITSLPDNLKVGGNFYLSYTNITTLPNNLHVGGYLSLYKGKIKSLGDNLQVGGSLYLYHTPLSDMYTRKDIRKMIEDKGGYVGEIIFT